MPEPLKRRRRPAMACVLCRKRKIRCNREYPCNNCLRSRTGDCVYENWPGQPAPQSQSQTHPQPAARSGSSPWRPQPIAPNVPESMAASAPSSHHASPASMQSPSATENSNKTEAEQLRLRIRELEDQLSRVNIKSHTSHGTVVSSSIETTSSRLGGTFHVQCDTPTGGKGPMIARSMTHKTRMFGQSHWCVTGVLLIRDLFETVDAELQVRGAQAWAGIEKCKALARFIKARRTPAWPVLSSLPLPDRAVADALVQHYMETTESLYRILHIPSFQDRYRALWDRPADAAHNNPAFLTQVKLVLALGAVTYDACFSLRPSAMQWAYEAQMYLAEPKFKSRLDIQTLQTSILLLLAQERLGIVGDSMWIASGALVRRALFMGLHRDPARLPDRSALTCEMHRRLWNTIIEMNLQASLGSGGVVFMSVSDFDTAPPGNFDDGMLLGEDPVPRPAGECTQMTVALALRDTFSQRLDVMRFLNDVSSGGSYEETLRLDGELRAAFRTVRQRLQSCTGHGAKPALSAVELRTLDTIMYRYLSAIHVPYFVSALQESRYAYSRTVVIDCALKVWNTLGGGTMSLPPQSSPSSSSSSASSSPPQVDTLRRQVTNATGFYMIAAMHSALLIVMELRAQLKESDGLGPKLLRPDLVTILQKAQEWSLEVIRAGHTNVKGYLLLRIIGAQIECLSRNVGPEALVEDLLMVGNEVAETCTGILTEMAERLAGGGPEAAVAVAQTAAPMPTPPDMNSDWATAALDDLLATAEGKTEGWPAKYGYDMDEFEWAMF